MSGCGICGCDGLVVHGIVAGSTGKSPGSQYTPVLPFFDGFYLDTNSNYNLSNWAVFDGHLITPFTAGPYIGCRVWDITQTEVGNLSVPAGPTWTDYTSACVNEDGTALLVAGQPGHQATDGGLGEWQDVDDNNPNGFTYWNPTGPVSTSHAWAGMGSWDGASWSCASVGSNSGIAVAFWDKIEGFGAGEAPDQIANTVQTPGVPGHGSGGPISFAKFNGFLFCGYSNSSSNAPVLARMTAPPSLVGWHPNQMTDVSGSLPDMTPGDVLSQFDPTNLFVVGSRLYFAAAGKNIISYTDDGTTWNSLTIPTPGNNARYYIGQRNDPGNGVPVYNGKAYIVTGSNWGGAAQFALMTLDQAGNFVIVDQLDPSDYLPGFQIQSYSPGLISEWNGGSVTDRSPGQILHNIGIVFYSGSSTTQLDYYLHVFPPGTIT